MSKKKKELFENVEINNAAYAQEIRDDSSNKLKRVKIGLIIAAITSLLTIIACYIDGNAFDTIIPICLIGSIASYIVGGGILTAFSWARKIGNIGFWFFPIPLNLAAGFTLLIMAFVCLFFLPVIFVFMNYTQIKKNYNAADKFLNSIQSAASC